MTKIELDIETGNMDANPVPLKYTAEISEKVKSGDFDILKSLLINDPEFFTSFINEECRTPLHDLCDYGTDVTSSSAASSSDPATQEMLNEVLNWYENRAPPAGDKFIHIRDKTKLTALQYAISKNNQYAIDKLIKYGATDYSKLLSDEVRRGNVRALNNYILNNVKGRILHSCTIEESRTPLHDVCDCETLEDANKMLSKVLDWYQSWHLHQKDFIHKQDKLGKTALHYAFKRHNSDAIKLLIDHGATLYTKSLSDKIKNGDVACLKKYVDDYGLYIKLASKEEGRTLLHDICDCGNKEAAKKMIEKFVNWYICNPKDRKFIDKKEMQEGNTALHYALKKKYRFAVNALVYCGASVHIENQNGKTAVLGIYERYPKTIMSLLEGEHQDQRITFEKDEDQEDDDDDKLEITCDFGAVIGIDLDRSEVYETYLLSNVLHLQRQTHAILDCLIVQLFLDLKWNRMKWLIYFSIAFHTFWSILSSCVIWSIFMTKCENISNNLTEWKQLENEDWNPKKDLNGLIFNSSIFLVLITFFILMKEVVEFIATPRKVIYLKQMENWCQLLLIVSIFVLLSNHIFSNFLAVWLDFNLSIIAFMTSCLLVLGQLNKQPKLGYFMEMFKEVSGNFRWLFFWFAPILVAFTGGLQMATALDKDFNANNKFQLWPPFGLIKIVAMSTGEYNYDEICESEVDFIKIPKNIIIYLFITRVGIVLSNLLIGLVVSDLESLRKNARVNSLATQLEQMYLMESFINKWLGWYSGLAKACWVTGNPSFTNVWPLSWFDFLWEKLETRNSWNRIRGIFLSSSPTSNEQHAVVSITEVLQSGGNISNEQNTSVVSTEQPQPSGSTINDQDTSHDSNEKEKSSGKTSHIVKTKMKVFSEQSKVRLMKLKEQRDSPQLSSNQLFQLIKQVFLSYKNSQ